VLKNVAQVCKTSLRKVDILGRIGGEEFAILLPQTPQIVAHDVAERIRRAVEESSIVTGSPATDVRVTISIGVASYTSSLTLDAMLKSADAALYQAKQAGRNRVCSVVSR